MSIQFWFEFGSTYSYPAALRIEAVCGAQSIPVEWKPFLLGPIFAAQGWSDSPFNIYPAKGQYMWRDLERQCAKYGFPFRRPSQFPRNGLLAARVACVASGEPWMPEFVCSVFRTNFAEDCEISDPQVIRETLKSLGQPGAELIERAQSEESKSRLRAQTEEAKNLGIFGAPSFIVAEELFWGNDRLEDAVAWHLERAA